MIERVRLRGFKSFEDVEVKLQPLSVLVGANATGKSNFLDALHLLSRIAQAESLNDAFDAPYRGTALESFHFGPDGVKGLLDQETASFTIEVDIEISDVVVETVRKQIRNSPTSYYEEAISSSDSSSSEVQESTTDSALDKYHRHLRYRIVLSIEPATGTLRIEEEYLAALEENGSLADRPPFAKMPEDRLKVRSDRPGSPLKFDTYPKQSLLSVKLNPLNFRHIVALREELSRFSFYYFEPREQMRERRPIREVDDVGMRGEDLAPFLNTLKNRHPRQFENLEKSLSTIVESVDGIDVGRTDAGQVELSIVEDSTPIPARLVSDGTLRILGLLCLSAMKEPPSLVGFEEPETGVTPRKIGLIARFLEARTRPKTSQYVVTTHSPLLADHLPTESILVCRKDGDATTIQSLSDIGWGPPSPDRVSIEKVLQENPERSFSSLLLRGDLQ
jgi:predicted ATPase